MFLKNCWYVVAWDHELIDGANISRSLHQSLIAPDAALPHFRRTFASPVAVPKPHQVGSA